MGIDHLREATEEGWEKQEGVGSDVQYARTCCGDILHQLIASNTGGGKYGAANVILCFWKLLGWAVNHRPLCLSACHQWCSAAGRISPPLLEQPRWFPVINTHSRPLIFPYFDVHCLITTLIGLLKLFSCTCLLHTHIQSFPTRVTCDSRAHRSEGLQGGCLVGAFSSIAIDRVLVHVLTVQRFASRCLLAHEVPVPDEHIKGGETGVSKGWTEQKAGHRVKVWNRQISQFLHVFCNSSGPSRSLQSWRLS